MTESNNYNDKCNINQTIPGQNNQVAGRDFIIHTSNTQDDKPALDNPNLITCPACDRYGVFRGADQCPSCHYSFLNARLEVQAEALRTRQKGVLSIFVFAAFVFAGGTNIHAKFGVGLLDSFVWSFLIISVLGIALLFGMAQITTWFRLRNR